MIDKNSKSDNYNKCMSQYEVNPLHIRILGWFEYLTTLVDY